MHPTEHVLGPNFHLKEAFLFRRRAKWQAGSTEPPTPYDLSWSVPFTLRIDLHENRLEVQHQADIKDVMALLPLERAEEMLRVLSAIARIEVRPVSAKRMAELENEAAHFEQLERTMGPEYLEFTE